MALQHRRNNSLYRRFPRLLLLQAGEGCEVLTSKNNESSLVLTREGESYHLHDPEQPRQEAELFVSGLKEVKPQAHVIFFGVGLGYHIREFLHRYPNTSFSIVEPDTGVMNIFLQHLNENDWLANEMIEEVMVGATTGETLSSLHRLIDRVSGVLVIPWLPYRSLFTAELMRFNEMLHRMVSSKKDKMAINHVYEKKWALNSMHNLPFILHSSDFLHSGSEHIAGKPALIVSAGPSLNDEIEHLRHIRENNLAYLFTVGSAVNTLVEHGIYPHGTFSYDPNEYNVNVIQKVIDKRIDSIPLIFGSTVGKHTLDHYPGRLMHIIISQDELSMHLLRTPEGHKPTIINDAPSVAVIALQCLVRMKADPIVLVGQNLAYRGEQYYAEGITNSPGVPVSSNSPRVEGVHGQQVVTNHSFIKMKKEMEFYINIAKDTEFINTTREGAVIKGTSFQNLEEVIQTRLKGSIDDSWLQTSSNSEYDLLFLRSRLEELQRDEEVFQTIMEQNHHALLDIKHKLRLKQANMLNVSFGQFDDLFASLLSNCFFKIYVLPRHRMGYEFLYSKMDAIQSSRNPLSRGEQILLYFGDFIWKCRQDYLGIKNEIHEFYRFVHTYADGKRKLKQKGVCYE
ncbi:motility associated factor glycosyltransferase family protein [Paenibacillus sp. BJ-4]|uniref:motility associated factor glycosyltransferase family protein n=1 Tax=Paenibacillus sp. BJ-4 TaxID=2878097 RepID=UPI001CF0BD13|nr:6-hydroxymethylpterin diphosphokinase MptE-like protein [Paenibacillus sp. BJ-4]